MGFMKDSGSDSGNVAKEGGLHGTEGRRGARLGLGRIETTEQRVESAMRVLFDLDGSQDASRFAGRTLRWARRGEDRPSMIKELRRIQFKLTRRDDEAACRRLADIVFEVAGPPRTRGDPAVASTPTAAEG